ncbi:MAG TPA: hypothetical protein PKD64_16835 [Pirellulaceae bacterium]|nr:hypothetical protein [Pirellulaceae bacterium]HMO93854.1 hypothetical protein [Pirellulaceae bacterium]
MNFAKFLDDPKSHTPSPAEVLRVANDNPYSSKCLELWRTGKCTWDEALAAAMVSVIEYVAEDPLRRKSTADKLPETPPPAQKS